MRNEQLVELKEKMTLLKKTMSEINEMWNTQEASDMLEGDYPFKSSFDELVLDVSGWCDTTHEAIDDNIEFRRIAFTHMKNTEEILEVNGENIERFSDIGLEHDDLHMGIFDTKKVHIYNELGYILEGVRLDSGKKVFITYISNMDFQSVLLHEIETALFEHHVYGELYYNDGELREELIEANALKGFINKA